MLLTCVTFLMMMIFLLLHLVYVQVCLGYFCYSNSVLKVTVAYKTFSHLALFTLKLLHFKHHKFIKLVQCHKVSKNYDLVNFWDKILRKLWNGYLYINFILPQQQQCKHTHSREKEDNTALSIVQRFMNAIKEEFYSSLQWCSG